MIQAIIILLVAGLLAWAVVKAARKARKGGGCCGEREAAPDKVKVTDRNKAHYPYKATLTIGGMTCENCARRVENALNQLDGVWARVSISDRRASVLSKQPIDETALRTAVSGAGYVMLGIVQ